MKYNLHEKYLTEKQEFKVGDYVTKSSSPYIGIIESIKNDKIYVMWQMGGNIEESPKKLKLYIHSNKMSDFKLGDNVTENTTSKLFKVGIVHALTSYDEVEVKWNVGTYEKIKTKKLKKVK